MKQIEITTTKVTLIVMDLKNGLSGLRYPINWKPLGFLSDLTENQWKAIVESYVIYEPWTQYPPQELWMDYQSKACSWTFTPAESGLSLLRANGVLLENPVKINVIGNNELNCDYAEWQNQKQKIWTNPYIFLKLQWP